MIELIIGGARSGKSRYALSSAERLDGVYQFIATGQAWDEEMTDRISRHKEERSDFWQLTEEPLYLSQALSSFSTEDVVIVDCLTLWVTNWLCQDRFDEWRDEKCAMLGVLKKSSAKIFLVSNETGMGIVPVDKLSRLFVDESGWLHQKIGEIAHRVVTVTAGIPSVIKEEADA